MSCKVGGERGLGTRRVAGPCPVRWGERGETRCPRVWSPTRHIIPLALLSTVPTVGLLPAVWVLNLSVVNSVNQILVGHTKVLN